MENTTTTDTTELFASLDATWNIFFDLFNSTDPLLINIIPFEGSWTIAQIATHIIKSNKGIIQDLQTTGEGCNRDAEEGVPQLKKMFLDLEARYNSPDFIIPERKEYLKNIVLKELGNSIQKLKQLRSNTNLTDIINRPIFGEVTKLEILYFVLYHTQRHIHQLKNILNVIDIKN